jgi:predicted enzyme related to lactoylglutathione lyase
MTPADSVSAARATKHFSSTDKVVQMPANFLGLRTINYHVADLAAAKKWYARVTGTEPYFDEPFYVGFDIGGFELGLDPDPASGMSGAGGTTAYWGVANAEDAVAMLVAAGATLRSAAREVGDGIKVGTVMDPFGNELGVIENPLFKLEDVR